MGQRITKVENFIRWCENHKLISILVIVGLVIIALGNFTNALETIYGLFKSSSQPISISNTNTPSEAQTKIPVSPSIADFTQITNATTVTQEPSKILDEISAAGPMQQDVVAKSFVGAKVRWLLKLSSVKLASEPIHDETLVMFHDDGKDAAIVCISISNDDKNLLRLSKKDDLFYVSGKIEKFYSSAIFLSDYKLESYPRDTNMK
jgi:hypothetical protein